MVASNCEPAFSGTRMHVNVLITCSFSQLITVVAVHAFLVLQNDTEYKLTSFLQRMEHTSLLLIHCNII